MEIRGTKYEVRNTRYEIRSTKYEVRSTKYGLTIVQRTKYKVRNSASRMPELISERVILISIIICIKRILGTWYLVLCTFHKYRMFNAERRIMKYLAYPT
jgi:hypothetical protein